MVAPCQECGRRVTIRYIHRDEETPSELCRRCHPEKRLNPPGGMAFPNNRLLVL